MIHGGSLRNRPVASRDGRAEARRNEAYSLQYVDRLSDEPAPCMRMNGMQVRRGSESAIVAEALMDSAGWNNQFGVGSPFCPDSPNNSYRRGWRIEGR